jgi:parallel beta-helix repeat protein
MRAIVVDLAQSAMIENCVVDANIRITDSSDVTVRRSTVTNGILWATASSRVVFDSNTANAGGGVLILLEEGASNRATNNVLDGMYNGGPVEDGVDDAILLKDETGDAIDNNTISNVFDAGIEAVGALSNTSMSGNTISNAGVAGLASFWCTAWTANTISGNTVTKSPVLARILYATGPKCGSTITPAAFADNKFIGNLFRTPASGTEPDSVTRMAIGMSGPVLNNLIQDNDFAANLGPWLRPAGGFVDGGGNVCRQSPPEFNVICVPVSAQALATAGGTPR